MDWNGRLWTEMDNMAIVFGPLRSINIHKSPFRSLTLLRL